MRNEGNAPAVFQFLLYDNITRLHGISSYNLLIVNDIRPVKTVMTGGVGAATDEDPWKMRKKTQYYSSTSR